MANEKDHPSSDILPEGTGSSGNAQSGQEDPLVELARIVSRNRQEAEAKRDGQPDYFAGLDELTGPAELAGSRGAERKEPSFGFASEAPAAPAAPTQAAPEVHFPNVSEPQVSAGHVSGETVSGYEVAAPDAVSAPEDDGGFEPDFTSVFAAGRTAAATPASDYPVATPGFAASSEDHAHQSPDIHMPQDTTGESVSSDYHVSFGESAAPVETQAGNLDFGLSAAPAVSEQTLEESAPAASRFKPDFSAFDLSMDEEPAAPASEAADTAFAAPTVEPQAFAGTRADSEAPSYAAPSYAAPSYEEPKTSSSDAFYSADAFEPAARQETPAAPAQNDFYASTSQPAHAPVEGDQSEAASANLAPDVMLDLEKSLNAEFEDELSGVLRRQFEPDQSDLDVALETEQSFDVTAEEAQATEAAKAEEAYGAASAAPALDFGAFETAASASDDTLDTAPRESVEDFFASLESHQVPEEFQEDDQTDPSDLFADTPEATTVESMQPEKSGFDLEGELSRGLGSAFGFGAARKDAAQKAETPKSERGFSFGGLSFGRKDTSDVPAKTEPVAEMPKTSDFAQPAEPVAPSFTDYPSETGTASASFEPEMHPEPTTTAPSQSGRFVFDDEELFGVKPAPASTEPQAEAQASSESSWGTSSRAASGVSSRIEDDLAAELGIPQDSFSTGRNASASIETSSSDDIDNMSWPAAASILPHGDDDETPPPPGGYDLDAVARAMHEGDPSLQAAIGERNVLAPEPAETTKPKRKVVYREEKNSRKGLVAAAAVVGVAVLGGGAFYLLSGNSVSVPDGPPPIIAGLSKELKVYPEAQAAETDDNSSKLIYDRVAGTGSGNERLILPEKTQPAELPPAPATTDGQDNVVPSGPKRVRTLVVRPDGTIVSNEQSATRVATVDPSQAANAGTSNGTGQSSAATQVPTTPVTTTTSEPALSVPGISTLGSNGQQPTTATPSSEPAAPQGPVETVTPTAKPAVPAQFASAQPTQVQTSPVQLTPVQTNPTPVAPVQTQPRQVQTSAATPGPLDLTAPSGASAPSTAPAVPQAAAQAPQVVSTSGSIPAGTFIVQVTSQRSDAAARETYGSLQRRFPSILGGREAIIVPATIEDRGTFYRARIPMGSRDDAISLCESLQAAGGDCFVRRN